MGSDVSQWLATLGLDKYAKTFAENDVDFRALPHLDRDDLKELGVSLGHRKIILAAIADLVADSGQIQARPGKASGQSETDSREGERRHLTVMFCDLVGSTELSIRLDPEDLGQVIRHYQEAVAGVIREFDGYLAKYMGDGVLVYFGYPQAHDRDAERAVRTGLGIIDSIAALGGKTGMPEGVKLAVRIGIDTGLVVVGELVGEGDARERTVVGETPNLAARLQGLAPPNSMVVGSTCRDLAGDAFLYEDLGARELKGVDGYVKAWRVLGLSPGATDEAGDAPRSADRSSLVGRDEEIGLLRRAWQRTKDEGRGQVVLISGEPGIGKTVLVDVLRMQAREEDLPRMAFRCSPFHAASAFHPVIEHLKQFLTWQADDAPEVLLDKLEQNLGRYSTPLEESVPVFASLLSLALLDQRYRHTNLSAEDLRQRTQDTLVTWTLEEAEQRPVLQVWEDLHWADPSTLDVMGLLLEQAPTAPLLLVLTFRPDFTPPWPNRSHMIPITLSRLEKAQIEGMVTHLASGKALPAGVVDHIVDKTDGVPLYVEELTKTILTSEILREETHHYSLAGALSSVTIPATLQESLMARLDQLPSVREVAQFGAVLGREFPYTMLQALAGLDEPVLQDGLSRLVDAELLYQRGRPPRAKYIFKHALVQDAAYQSLLKRSRQRHHKRVAELTRSRFPDLAAAQPELVARHYTEAGLADEAIEHWHEAGRRAALRAANLEAIDHLRNAFALLPALPSTPARTTRELALQIDLASTLSAIKGYANPEVGEAFARARELCHQVGSISQTTTVLRGLWIFHFVRGDLQEARKQGEDCFSLTSGADDRALLLEGHNMLGDVLFCLGEFSQARKHLESGIALYNPDEHGDEFLYGSLVGILPVCFAAHTLWHLGYPDQAVRAMDRALALAEQLAHPFGRALALDYTAMLHQFRREAALARTRSEAAIELCAERGYAYYLAWGQIIQGWALVDQGGGAEELERMRQGLASLRATGAALRLPYYLVTLGEASGKAGRTEDGLADLAEAEKAARANGECWREAERHRLRGELLLSREPSAFDEAESALLRAAEVARRQHAKSLELRAALSLGRLWRDTGRTLNARDLLVPIYGWFTEGFDTADLADAKALLDELS